MKISNLEIRKRLTGSSKSKIKGGNKWSRFLKDPNTKKAYYCGIEKVCEDLQPPQQQQPQQYQQQPLIPAPSAYEADRPPMANIPQTSNIPPAPPLPPPAQIINNAVNNMSLKDVLKMNRKLNKGEKLNVKDEAELAKNDHMAILMKAVREGKKLKKVEKKEQVEKVGQPDARSIMMEALMKGKKLKKVVRQEKKVEEPSEMDELRQKLSLRRTQIKEEEGEVQPEEWGEGLWNRKGLFCWFRTANGKMFKVCVPPSRFKPFNPKRAGVKKPVKKMLVKKTTKKRPKEIKKVTNKTQVRKEVKRQLNKLPKNIIKQVPKNIIKEIENEVVEKAMEGLPTMKEFKKTMKKEKQQIKKEMEKLEKISKEMKKSKKKEEPKPKEKLLKLFKDTLNETKILFKEQDKLWNEVKNKKNIDELTSIGKKMRLETKRVERKFNKSLRDTTDYWENTKLYKNEFEEFRKERKKLYTEGINKILDELNKKIIEDMKAKEKEEPKPKPEETEEERIMKELDIELGLEPEEKTKKYDLQGDIDKLIANPPKIERIIFDVPKMKSFDDIYGLDYQLQKSKIPQLFSIKVLKEKFNDLLKVYNVEWWKGWTDRLCSKNYKNFGSCNLTGYEILEMVYNQSKDKEQFKKLQQAQKYPVLALLTNYLLMEVNKKYDYMPIRSLFYYNMDYRNLPNSLRNSISPFYKLEYDIMKWEELNDTAKKMIVQKYKAYHQPVFISKIKMKYNPKIKKEILKGMSKDNWLENQRVLLDAYENEYKDRIKKDGDLYEAYTKAKKEYDNIKNNPQFIPATEIKERKEEPEPEPKANNNIRNEEELKRFYDNYNDFKSARQQARVKKILEKITTKDNFEGLMNLLVSSKRYNDFFPTPQSCLDSKIAVNEIKRANHIYEPTAGLGSLIYGAYKINPNVKISANELMKDNADFIKYNFPNCKTTTEDFLKMDVKPNDYDLYLLNPPFTKGGDKRFYLNFLFKAFEFMDNYKYNDTPNMIFFSPQLTESKDRDEKVGDVIDLVNLRNVSDKKKLELYNEYKGENLKKLTNDDFENLIYEDLPIYQIQVIDTCKFQTTGIKVHVYLFIGTRDPSKPKRPEEEGKGLFLGSGLSGGDMSSQLLEDIRKGKKLRKSVQKEIIEKPNEIMSALKQKLKSIRKDVDDEDEDEIDYENDYDDEDEIDNEENEEEELKSIPTAPPLPDLLRKKVKLPELEMAEDKEELPELEEKNNKNLIYREMDLRTKFYTYENTKMYDNDDLLYKKKILDAPESYYSGGELYRNVKNDERNNDLRKKNIELLNQRNNYGFYKWFSVKVQ